MSKLYNWLESTVMWGAVFAAIGLVVYLAYLQYLKVKRRRARRRHRAHRTMRRQNLSIALDQPDPGSQSPLQQSTKL